eukprot:Gb_27619 [translate_table: standard]
MSVLGCLMLQSIFKYPNEFIQQFCSSFASMEVDHIVEAAKDPGGSRVIEAFLSSNAPLKHKHRVISKFRGHFGQFAQQPSSSFTVAKCFLAADVALKEVITSELASVQGELSRSKHGSHLLKNCDVARYAKGPDQWRSSQSSKQSTRQAFAQVFGSEVEAKKEDDCGVVSCKEEDATEAPMKGMKKSKRGRKLQNTGDEMDNSVLNKEDLSKLEHSMAELGFAIHKRAKRDVNHKAEMNVHQSENHKVNTASAEVSLSKGKMKKKSGADDIEEIFCKKGKAKKSNKRRKMIESRYELADVESVQVTIDSSMNNVLNTLEQGSKKKKRSAIDHRTSSAKKQKQQKQIVYI